MPGAMLLLDEDGRVIATAGRPARFLPGPTGAPAREVRVRLSRSPAPDGRLRFLARLDAGDGAPGDAYDAEQAALHRVARAVAESLPPEDLFDRVAQEVAGLLGVEAGIVWRFEGETSIAVGAFGEHLTGVGTRFPLRGEGALPRVWATGLPVRVAYDAIPEDDPTRERVGHQGYRSGVAAPVRVAGRAWGAVLAATTREGGLPEGAEERLGNFAELVGLAITNIEDRRALSDRAAEQAVVGRVATAVAAGRRPAEILDLVCREVTLLTGAAVGGVSEFTAPGTGVVRAAWSRGTVATLPIGAEIPVTGGLDRPGPGPPVAVRRAFDPAVAPAWRAAYGETVSAAITVGGAPWGLVSVAAAAGGTLPPDTERRLQGLADLAGVAIANADARAAVEAEAEEQAALRRVATACASGADLDDVLRLLCREVADLLGVEAVALRHVLDGDQAQIVAGWTAEGLPGPEVGSIHVVPDPSDRTWAGAYRDAVTAPVILGDELWGTLGVASAHRTLPAAVEATLQRFADQAGVAIASEEARRRSVHEATDLIAGGSLDMDATLRAIAHSARRAMFADRVTCALVDARGAVTALHTTEEDPVLRDVVERGYRQDAAGSGLWRQIMDREETIHEIEDVADSGHAHDAALAAYIAVRLEHRGTILGAIVAAYRVPRGFAPRDRATLRTLASVAALSVVNAQLHGTTLATLADAEERAATDALTGLANHRAFQERLREEAERARRHGRPLALAIFDLDRFKEVNDRHGHQVGDAILVEVAGRLAAQSRPGDMVARLGGEEFAWILPESDSLDAWQAAERLREAVRATPFVLGEPCTMSGGVAELAQARDPGDLVRLADGALYWAKEHGRDVSFRYSPEVVEELSAAERAERLERSQALNAIRVLARAVDAKDPSTRRHSERVAELADLLAAELSWPLERRLLLRGAGLVHDVGKIGVPDSILFKPERLTSGEYEQVKQHARLGGQIVADALTPEQVDWVRGHHERIDGAGYPDGLAGDAIPEGARILAVADAWDVMTSARPYAAPIPPEAAIAECRRVSGSQFWPAAVEALERLLASGRATVATRD